MTRPLPSAVEAAFDSWNVAAHAAGLWWSRFGRADAGALARRRLEDLVAYSRAHSPFYRERYAGLPRAAPLSCLPVVEKATLMGRFEDWATDREVTRSGVERFLAGRHNIGERYLGRYHAWKSSGTSGTPGIFLQDAQAMAIYDALVAAQLDARAVAGVARLAALGGRAALVVATGDHFASITMWEHARSVHPGLDARSFSVLTPLPLLVGALNACAPAFLSSYPSVLALLAAEREAGRLAIAPALIWSGGETLAPAAQARIERAFNCPVMNEYGASECLSIAYGCAEGWLHLNEEWVLLEGVDARHRPVPAGVLSHTTLLTNLANRVQPVIRYDIGDRTLARPDPCPCGNPAPARRIAGRDDALVRLRAARGRIVRLAPLALSTVVEAASGEHRVQVAQVAADALLLRLDGLDPRLTRAAAGRRAVEALRAYLARQGAPRVRVALDPRAPRPDGRSGKLRAFVDETRCTVPGRRA